MSLLDTFGALFLKRHSKVSNTVRFPVKLDGVSWLCKNKKLQRNNVVEHPQRFIRMPYKLIVSLIRLRDFLRKGIQKYKNH